MSFIEILIPYSFFLLGGMVWFFLGMGPIVLLCNAVAVGKFYKRSFLNDFGREPSTVYGFSQDGLTFLFAAVPLLIWILFYFGLFLYLSAGWLNAKPTDDWQKNIKTIDTAIIFGFGFEEGEKGQILPGKANEFLLQWTLDHTKADTLLVQEGVWAAVCKSTEATCEKIGRTLIRIHCHDEDIDVNTFQAAYCALEKMEELGKKSAILIAHDLQLERVAWDFDRLKQSRGSWSDFTFVVPKIPKTPSLKNSAQLRTRSRLVYSFVELFWSRMRDRLSKTPKKCIAPFKKEVDSPQKEQHETTDHR